MISKFYYAGVFILFLMGFSCKISSSPIKDINGCSIIEKMDSTKVYYVKEDGTKLIAYLGGVEFNEGRDSLINYIKRVYYDNPDYHKYSEFNVIERFFVLFDKSLNIVEVRIMHRLYANNQRFYYDNILVNAIKSTSGMWYKTLKDKKYYITFIQLRIY